LTNGNHPISDTDSFHDTVHKEPHRREDGEQETVLGLLCLLLTPRYLLLTWPHQLSSYILLPSFSKRVLSKIFPSAFFLWFRKRER
jgi:hypothetical protein